MRRFDIDIHSSPAGRRFAILLRKMRYGLHAAPLEKTVLGASRLRLSFFVFNTNLILSVPAFWQRDQCHQRP